MKNILILALALSAPWSKAAAAQEQNSVTILTLAQCEELAFKNNLSIRDAALGLEVSKARQKQASHARFLPKFSLRNVWGVIPKAGAIVDPITGFPTSPDTSTSLPGDLRPFTELEIDLVQPIFTFGKLSSLSEAAYFGVEADEARLVGEREKVRFDVRQLYWALVLGNELLAVVKSAETELSKAETKIEEKLDAGSDEVSQTDLFKVQIFRYQINKQLRDANGKMSLTKSALSATLGLDDTGGFAVATEYLDPVEIEVDSVSIYLEMARKSRPELARLRASVQAKQALTRMQKSDYYPQLFLAGQLKYNYAKDRFDSNQPFVYNPTNYFRPGIVLGLNMNLNFWQTRDKVRVAEAEFLQLARKEEQLLTGLNLEVEKTYLELVQAGKNMQDSRRAARASENWLRSATMTFDIGVGEVKDLIDAFKANAGMQAEHFQNIFDFNVAAAKLSKVVGRNLYPN